jgi:hypothetical protein
MVIVFAEGFEGFPAVTMKNAVFLDAASCASCKDRCC